MDSSKKNRDEDRDKDIELARIIAKRYNIKSSSDWIAFIKGIPQKEFLSFKEARKFVRKLKIKNLEEWKKYCVENDIDDIPSHPAKQYKNDWVSWGDFLGVEHKVPSKFLPYEEARKFVISLGIKSCKEWNEYCQSGLKPKDIPHSPQKIYKDGKWMGWDAFFAAGRYSPKMSDEQIQWDVVMGKALIGEEMEALRGDMTDEEIIEAYKQDAPEIIEAIKKYFKKYPREEE